ncbi:hypothetical protein LENED_002445 [Lentinula edodes]|uniref:Uncharacterized protein n=1 Tax=Lentinula edodes TaxID=5353 RepID=A0A1Q3E0V2_LENED|nr:hypothetical protein LENED_002445 [Lentinula edodes]
MVGKSSHIKYLSAIPVAATFFLFQLQVTLLSLLCTASVPQSSTDIISHPFLCDICSSRASLLHERDESVKSA